jgi:hypothetical protein
MGLWGRAAQIERQDDERNRGATADHGRHAFAERDQRTVVGRGAVAAMCRTYFGRLVGLHGVPGEQPGVVGVRLERHGTSVKASELGVSPGIPAMVTATAPPRLAK